MKKIKVVELFAGVGGFRLGFEKSSNKKYNYDIVWSNQWEPSTKIQHASDIYIKKFGKKNHSNKDITKVCNKEIPKHDLLVGGFPCQDYSVAKILSQSKGIVGNKGVLWWEIHRIIKSKKTKYILLENVDRIIKSPANQRGRDFAIILKTLSDLKYNIEWRVIDASEYGMPQRRKRVFIFGYKEKSTLHKNQLKLTPKNIIFKKGIFAKSFPVLNNDNKIKEIQLDKSLTRISNTFGKKSKISFFENAGFVKNGKIFTTKIIPSYKGRKILLKDVLQKEKDIPKNFYIKKEDLKKWKYLKGSKREERVGKNGNKFIYCEGSMSFPDNLLKASRTIITAEGGSSASRFKHIIKVKDKYRRLTPIELERLCMFPDNHTVEASDTKRAFFMGNALVVGIVEKFALQLGKEYVRK